MFVTERDHRAALTLVGDAAAAVSRAEFVAIVLPGLRRIAASTETSYGEVATRTWRWTKIDGFPTMPSDLPGAARAILHRPAEHPWVGWLRQGFDGTVRLSQLHGDVPLERLPFYADFYRPRGLRHAEYLVITRTTGHAIGVSPGRSERDYSDREHDLLEHVRVPLGRAWRVAWRTERLYAAAGRDLDDVPAELDILTDAERHVAALVMHGLDNAGIAEVLDVSVKAVEQHLTHIYRRLGVRSRTQLVIRIRQSSDAESVKVVKAGGNCAAAVAGSCS